MEYWFAIFGMVVAGIIAVAVALVVMLLAILFLLAHFPRFHIGRTKLPIEWRTYDTREILTTKDGKAAKPTGRGKIVQQLSVQWWLGLSSRNRAAWFLGFIRTANSADVSHDD